MKEDDSLDTFISKYQSAYDTAISTSNKIDEEMKVDIMFGALPTSWGPFIVIHGADPTLSLQNLVSKMKQEDLPRRKRQNVSHNPHMAMIATMKNQRGNFNRNKFRNNNKYTKSIPSIHDGNKFHNKKSLQNKKSGAHSISSQIICRYCGKAGHMERDCRKKQYDYRNKSKRNSAHVHTASV